jgi:hypothetical protein
MRIFLLFLTFSVFAKNENFPCAQPPPGLDANQVAAMCKAASLEEKLDSVSSDEFLKEHDIYLSPTDLKDFQSSMTKASLTDPYDIGILASADKTCPHSIVFMGEDRTKLSASSQAGKDILAAYRFRGYEFADPAYSTYLNSNQSTSDKHVNAILRSLTEKKVVFQSTIFDALRDAISFQYNNVIDWNRSEKYVADDGVSTTNYAGLATFLARGNTPEIYHSWSNQKCWADNAPVNDRVRKSVQDPELFLENFRDLINGDPAAKFNFHLERDSQLPISHCLDLTSPRCKKELIDDRNELMVKNIRRIVPKLPCGAPFLVMVESGHVPGQMDLLRKSGDYN